jgi:chemotaxis protein CheX
MALQERFVDAVCISVASLFNTMVPLDFDTSNASKQVSKTALGYPQELVGTIDIRGGISGSISILLSYPLAISMASLMLEEEIGEVNEDVYEAVAEIINIIAGGIKTALSQSGQAFLLGLPQVFDLGPQSSKTFPIPGKDQLPIAIPIQTGQGAFCVASLLREERPL